MFANSFPRSSLHYLPTYQSTPLPINFSTCPPTYTSTHLPMYTNVIQLDSSTIFNFLLSPVLSLSLSLLVWDAVSASLVACLIWSGMLCPPPWACLSLSPVLSPRSCVRLLGIVFLSPSLSPIWSGMLCPPPWACLFLVFGLVSQLVSHLVWDAVFVSSQAVCCWGSLCFLSVSALPGMLCPPCWACLSLAAGLVSHLVFQLVCVRLPGLVSQLVFGLFSQLVSHVVFHLVWDAVLPAGLGSCVRALGLSPKFHVRFVQLFGVYGGVIFNILWFVLYVLIIFFLHMHVRLQCLCVNAHVRMYTCSYTYLFAVYIYPHVF